MSEGGMGFSGLVEGDKELFAALNSIPEKMRKGVYKTAMRAALKPVLRQARKNLKSSQYYDSGAASRAQTSKIREYKKGGTVYGIVGADADYTETVQRRGKKKPEKVRPRNYVHFIEFGTPNMPPKPYMRPALDTSREAVSVAMAEGVSKGLDKETRKVKKKIK